MDGLHAAQAGVVAQQAHSAARQVGAAPAEIAIEGQFSDFDAIGHLGLHAVAQGVANGKVLGVGRAGTHELQGRNVDAGTEDSLAGLDLPAIAGGFGVRIAPGEERARAEMDPTVGRHAVHRGVKAVRGAAVEGVARGA